MRRWGSGEGGRARGIVVSQSLAGRQDCVGCAGPICSRSPSPTPALPPLQVVLLVQVLTHEINHGYRYSVVPCETFNGTKIANLRALSGEGRRAVRGMTPD